MNGISLQKISDGIFTFSELGDVFIGVRVPKNGFINYSDPNEKIRFSEKDLLCQITSIPPERIVMLNQVHGDSIIKLDEYPEKNLPWIADADGMITALPGLCLVIRTADCVPVFSFDSEKKILGAAHAGWRGCRLNIAGKLIHMMKDMGSRPEDISIFILPSICPDSYCVGKDVARFFPHERFTKHGKIYVDLWKSVESSAVKEGIASHKIYNPRICTLINEEFFSHRRGDIGRNLNFAYII